MENQATAEKPRATKADLEREKAKLLDMKRRAEIDWDKLDKSKAAQNTWDKQVKAGGPIAVLWQQIGKPAIHQVDDSLHKDLHAQHYVVATLEREIAVDAVEAHPVVAEMMRSLGQKLTRAGS